MLAGVLVLVLLIPVNSWVFNKLRGINSKLMKKKDDRIKLMNEIINGIKVTK